MDTPVRARTTKELRILKDLHPHTRAHVLLLLGEHPGLTITSGRRTPAGNRRVGGSPSSFHLQGRGVDFAGTKETLVRAAHSAWRLRTGPACTGPEEVILEDLDAPNQHLHCAW